MLEVVPFCLLDVLTKSKKLVYLIKKRWKKVEKNLFFGLQKSPRGVDWLNQKKVELVISWSCGVWRVEEEKKLNDFSGVFFWW